MLGKRCFYAYACALLALCWSAPRLVDAQQDLRATLFV
jgi:hypothetical protein